MNRSHENDTTADLEETLEASQRFGDGLQSLIDMMPTVAWRAQPDGSTDFMNQRFYEYTGLSPKDAAGWGWKAIIHPDDLAQVMKYWQEVLSSGAPGEWEVRMRRFDGEYRWFLSLSSGRSAG